MKHLTRAHLWPIAIVASIYSASSQSTLAAPDPGFSYDKIAHFLVFGLLATAVLRIPQLRNMNWRGVLIAAAIVSFYGVCDEFRQSLTPGRSVEFADWIADTAGALLASVLYLKWHWYRNVLEWPPKKKPAPKEESQ